MSQLPVLDGDHLKAAIREHYGQAALQKVSCCGGSCGDNPITGGLYDADQTGQIPAQAVLASLGCGNPTALAELHPGEVVLDLGSGGGIDVLLSARRVGPTGKAYGLDMTDEMLALARANARRAGATNVEFLRGDIERIPLPDHSVDVIISNCVINLAADKRKVLAEAFRVLKPGGRFAVSDIVVLGEVPAEVRKSAELWMGCIAGALDANEFMQLLREAGFTGARVEPTRVYRVADVRDEMLANGFDLDRVADQVDGKFAAAFVRARKPKDQELVRVRAATSADRPRVTELLTGAALPLDGIPADLARFLVAETDADGVIAAAGLELYGPSALLRSAVVDPAWQGSGVGTVMVEATLDAARVAGAKDVFLLTTAAADYFPKHGFVSVERSTIPAALEASAELRGACPDSATVMHRALQ